MPNHPHLLLPRIEIERPRKKTGFGRPPHRNYEEHGTKLWGELDEVSQRFEMHRRPHGIDPTLILRVQLGRSAAVEEAAWERSGLVLLSVDENKTLVLFASDSALTDFKRRLSEYQAGPTGGHKGAPHQQVFAAIDNIGDIGPIDRIGRLLRESGILSPEQITDGETFVVDVELWDIGTRNLNQGKVREITEFVQRSGGTVRDSFIGESLVLLRLRVDGTLLKQILDIDYVAVVDLPPRASLAVGQLLETTLADLPAIPAPPGDCASIAVLDSGVASAHPVLAPAIGEATAIPQSLGDAADAHGHGTAVCGIALYGDVEDCVRRRSFVPQLALYSARVLNASNQFDDESLITTQMADAIRYFRDTYQCRVFNVSLGDDRLPYLGGKVSPWAAVLDTLARELDVVIIVSAGNYDHEIEDGNPEDGHLTDYPRYLLRPQAKIIEPATGSIVLTVGALANSESVPAGGASNSVGFRPIALRLQPSPFTRSGPGLGGAIKPELCEFGGNYAYDGQLRQLRRSVSELSVLSTNNKFVERLFVADCGTSFAAPRVSHIAARLVSLFPSASANLVRALLVSSANVPQESAHLLQAIDSHAPLLVCGYGRPDLELSTTSLDSRVVMYADSSLAADGFHVYEIPIPQQFLDEDGTRRIAVTVTFDPPVRHTRFDYLGTKMSFRLIRGKTIDEIVEAFRHRAQSEPDVDTLTSTKFDCDMDLGPTVREPGTLQRGVFTMKRKPKTDYGNSYFLVVRCERKWARDEHFPQRYAAVVVVEHSAEIDLYSRIQNRVRQAVQVRARA